MPPLKLPLKASLQKYFVDLSYLEAAMLARKLPKATVATALVDGCLESESLVRKALRAVAASQAVLKAADVDLDEAITEAGVDVLAAARGNRKAEPYRSAFRDSPSETKRLPYADEIQRVAEMVPVLADSSDDKLKGHAETLASRAEAVTAGVKSRNEARSALYRARLAVTEWKEGVNRRRLSLYAHVLDIATELGKDKAWAEAFFYRPDSDSPDEPEVPAPPAVP